MNESEANDKKTTAATEAAWERLQKQLEQEPVNAQWVRWSKQEDESIHHKTNEEEVGSLEPNANIAIPPMYSDRMYNLEPESSAEADKKGIWLNWMKQHKKWLSGVVAAAVLAVTIFTPVGNEALASILNKFQMEQVTVVQEDDIERMMHGVFTEGRTEDAINKFGSFSHTSGTLNGEYALADAEKLLKRKLVLPESWNSTTNKIYIQPSNEITLNLDVDEVNKALQRLGAKKLLPASIDGKPIKLHFSESVYVSKQVAIEGMQRNVSIIQMTAPSIEVDPAIPVEEAMDAVMQFPFLPDNLKDGLKHSGVLDNGNLPLPVIANGKVEKHTVEGVEVVATQREFNHSRTADVEQQKEIYYELTWVKNGQLYNINGDGFMNQNEAFALAKELIQQ